MKTRKTVNQKIDPLYIELFEEDKRYGGSNRLERAASEMRDRRPLKNLKKAWMEHTEDYDEVDEFYEH
jgi:hypothetical protein